ncbi:beta-galactosidase [Halobacillus aidingensis]|uniref:Beta-galactosidase n=1 Tax=Halobacillus aidingensis TaxID=240303 RepID=A0A1H0KUD9_HALAD|nr:beta-galactosidase trimerization domain-containing protein [Halobacillus aidingensis]SDO59587.1 beta-galactosidase [Halobacillus aidingensis]
MRTILPLAIQADAQLLRIRFPRHEHRSDRGLDLAGLQVPASISVWRDLLVPEQAETLYSYQDQFYKQYAAVTKNTFGKGNVYYVGGGLSEEALEKIAADVTSDCGIETIESDRDVEVYRRHIGGDSYLFLMNHSDKEKSCGNEKLGPFESRIVKG